MKFSLCFMHFLLGASIPHTLQVSLLYKFQYKFRLLTLFACFWKDNDSSVSKLFKNLKIVDIRKINKHHI